MHSLVLFRPNKLLRISEHGDITYSIRLTIKAKYWLFRIELLINISPRTQMSNVADELPDGPADLPSCLRIMYNIIFLFFRLSSVVLVVINIVLIT